jgi:hypothetical protein
MGEPIKVIKVDAREQHGTAILPPDESVWVTLAPAWWDIATWLWWWLAPSDRKAWLALRTRSGGYVRSRAIRVAHRHVRIGYIPKKARA